MAADIRKHQQQEMKIKKELVTIHCEISTQTALQNTILSEQKEVFICIANESIININPWKISETQCDTPLCSGFIILIM